MFEQLSSRFARIVKNIKGQGKITDGNIAESLRDVRRALLEADVNFKVARSFVDRVKAKASGERVFTSVTPGQQFVKMIESEMASFLGTNDSNINFNKTGRTVILLVGLQGSGKTTTTVKLASFLKKKWHRNSYLIAADLQRPAAIEQLQVMASKLNIPVFSSRAGNVRDVVKKGLLLNQQCDTVIIDTAGRLHLDKKMMDELVDVVGLAKPDEILYVADGMTGQDAVNSSNSFNEIVDLTGIILTKMDGDSRGGAALSIREVTGKPIKFIGIGEKSQDFEIFYPDRIAKRILGMGDVVSLVEKAKESFDENSSKKIQEKILNNTFNLDDFKEQIIQIQKMGSISDIVKMIPGFGGLNKLRIDDSHFIWIDAIIKSMTPYERNNPEIINGSRRKRIAFGSGRGVQEVNRLLKQFHQMKIMMKKINNKGNNKFPFNFKRR